MDKVKELIGLGLSVPSAIKGALESNGLHSVREFCDKYDLRRGAVSNHLNATVRPTDDTIAALIAELGGTENAWRELLWQAMRPSHLAAS